MSILGGELEREIQDKLAADYKSKLQQVIQSKLKITPVYRTVEETGPDHARVFIMEVLAGDSVLGRGKGRSKQAAEMAAAREALESTAGD